MSQLRFGSLFAGIGGFDLGFERAGLTCYWQVEIDDYANRVLENHWPSVRRWRDVRTFPPEPTDEWHVDVICGGFPCQDISYAGRGAGLEGERSGLFFEAVRVVRELRPRIIVLENVAALLARGLDRVLGELAAIGFDAEWHCIPAAAIGAPHIRDRIFVLGLDRNPASDGGDQVRRISARENSQSGRVCSTISNPSGSRRTFTGSKTTDKQIRTDRGGKREIHGIDEFGNDGRNWILADANVDVSQRLTQGSQQIEPVGENWWSIEPDVGRVADGVPHRVDRLRGLGNAVVPQVAEWIGRQIVDAVRRPAC